MTTILHIGLPKTGSTSIQAALNDSPHVQAFTDRAIAWDAWHWKPWALDEFKRWEPCGALDGVRKAEGTRPMVVSQEDLCRLPFAAIDRIYEAVRPDRVVMTVVPFGVQVRRLFAELQKLGLRHDFEAWLDRLAWQGRYPSFDGLALRPDVVRGRWSRRGIEVEIVDTSRAACARFFNVCEIPVGEERHENVSGVKPEVEEWMEVVDHRIRWALCDKTVADFSDLNVRGYNRFAFREAEAR